MPLTNDERILLRDMEDVARERLRLLIPVIEGSPIKDYTYAIRSRVKNHESSVAKIEKKRRTGKPDYGPGDLTDVIGARLVTLYRTDMLLVLDHLCDLICNSRRPFKGQVVEAQVISTGPHTETLGLSGKAQRIIKDKLGIDPLAHDKVYSSIHILALLEVPTPADKVPKPYGRGVPVEIQIRTLFEDAWGEVDHSAVYKGDGAADGSTGTARFVRPHVDILKQMMDAAAGHADLIKKLIDEPEDPPLAAGKVTPSASSAGDVAALLRELGVSETISSGVRGLITKRDEVYGSASIPWPEKQQILERLGDEFRRFEEKERSAGGVLAGNNAASAALEYYLLMERALTYVYAETQAAFEEAIRLYHIVESAQPKSFWAQYRLAHAYGKRRKVDDSIDHFKETLRLLDSVHSWSDAERHLLLLDYRPEDLKWRTRKLLGFQYYQKSLRYNESENTKDKLNYLKMAFELTKIAGQTCDEEDSKISINNNLLYYAAEHLKITRAYDRHSSGLVPEKELRKYLNIAQSNLDNGPAQSRTAARFDTVAFVSDLLGEGAQALAAAEMVFELLQPDGYANRYPEDELQTMVTRAWQITKKYRRKEPELPKKKPKKIPPKSP